MKKTIFITLLGFGFLPFYASAQSATPTITSLTPNRGAVGTVVNITGSGLTGASNVQFYNSNGLFVAAIPSSASSDSLTTFTVSPTLAGMLGAGTYQVSAVTNNCPGGCDSNRISFTIVTAPTIDYVQSPAESRNVLHPGERAYVYGTDLSAQYYVQFRDNPNSPDRNYVLSDAGNFTVPQLPDGWYGFMLSDGSLSSNKITVRIANATSAYAPTISSISPSTVAPGETVTIYGSNFNNATYAFLDSIYAQALPSILVSSGSLKATVPIGTSDGGHNLYVAEKGSNYPLGTSVFLTIRNNYSVAPAITNIPVSTTITAPVQNNEELIKQLQAILQSLIQQLIILLQQQAAAVITSGR
jgi:hypothetical protein